MDMTQRFPFSVVGMQQHNRMPPLCVKHYPRQESEYPTASMRTVLRSMPLFLWVMSRLPQKRSID